MGAAPAGDWSLLVEITPASIDQIRVMRSGNVVEIPAWVSEFAQRLADIHQDLRLRAVPARAGKRPYMVVYQLLRDEHTDELTGNEQLVTTAHELNKALLDRIEHIVSGKYDLVAELHKAEAEAERREDHERQEKLGPTAERLIHAARQDLGIKDTIFVPGKD